MRADLHVHTNFSYDGYSTPEEVVDAALSKGLNYIAITDHDTTEGAERARKYAEGKGIVVLIGQELSCKDGDILAINIHKELPAGISVHDAVLRIHKQGGYAIAPHPYGARGIAFLAFTNDFDAVEEINGNDILNLNFNTAKVAKRFRMPAIAASAAHYANDVGNCGIEFTGDIFDCLVEGRFKLFGRKNSWRSVLTWKMQYRFSKLFAKKVKHDKKRKAKQKEESL